MTQLDKKRADLIELHALFSTLWESIVNTATESEIDDFMRAEIDLVEILNQLISLRSGARAGDSSRRGAKLRATYRSIH